MDKVYWADAILRAAYIINGSPTKSLSYKTPEPIWTRYWFKVSHMRIFGCEAMLGTSTKRKKEEIIFKITKKIFLLDIVRTQRSTDLYYLIQQLLSKVEI